MDSSDLNKITLAEPSERERLIRELALKRAVRTATGDVIAEHRKAIASIARKKLPGIIEEVRILLAREEGLK